jgi:hypothetical protein
LTEKIFAWPGAWAVYSFESANQVGASDLITETFAIAPRFQFKAGSCNTDRLAASASLSPAAVSAANCDDPSDPVKRPRFREVYELTLQSLSEYSAMAGSEDLALRLIGSGFTPASVARWNGQARPTSFSGSTELNITIPVADLATAGTGWITVTNPSPAGEESNGLSFTITPKPLMQVFPRLVTYDSALEGAGNREYTGIALVNRSGSVANLTLTAFDRQGTVLSGDGIKNPARLKREAGKQAPFLTSEIFGSGLDGADQVGWIKVEGNIPQITGFFLCFDDSLERLDGAEVAPSLLTSFVFPEIGPEGDTQLHLVNPHESTASVAFELVQPDGSLRTAAQFRSIRPNGTLATNARDLFGGTALNSSDYIRVSSDPGVAAFEHFHGKARDYAGMNGRDRSTASKLLYSPQYVAGGDWKTALSIINLSARQGAIRLRFFGDDGTQIGLDQTVIVAAGGKVRTTDPGLFVPAGSPVSQGYLEISTDGILVTGDVVFSGVGEKTFASALPLVTPFFGTMTFSQVASNSTFFTGLALLNPDQYEALAIVQVFDRDGNPVAARTEVIPPRGRASRLITEFFPNLTGKDLGSGYIVVTGMRPIAAFSLFGTHDLSVLSAIPAQILP